jgi:hypothetical protein
LNNIGNPYSSTIATTTELNQVIQTTNPAIMFTIWSAIALLDTLPRIISGLLAVYDFYHNPLSYILPFFGVVPGQLTPFRTLFMGLTILLFMIIFTYVILDYVIRGAVLLAKKLLSFIWTLYLNPFCLAVLYAIPLGIAIRLLELYMYESSMGDKQGR